MSQPRAQTMKQSFVIWAQFLAFAMSGGGVDMLMLSCVVYL